MLSKRAGLLVATWACLFVMLSPASLASETASPRVSGAEATLEVTVVHATKGAPSIDPKLKDLASYLKTSLGDYNAFAQKGSHRATVKVGAATSVSLPDTTNLTLSYRGVAKGFVKVYLELDGLKTTVDVRDGGLFFQAGRRHKGGILVLAIKARTGGA